jgi:DNA-binding HxlR family transcriptional regulator
MAMTRPLPGIMDEKLCSGFQSAVELIGRRWSAAILVAMAYGAERFSEIARTVDGLSDRLLSQRLKELEKEGLIVRTIVPTTPVQTRYTLSDRGQELMKVLRLLAEWAAKGS